MSSRLVAFCVAAIVALAAFFAREAFVRSDTMTLRAPVVYAERAGLRLPMLALSDRVALVASADAVRWRIRGATEWRESTRRVLIRAWDTTKVPDGPYALDIRDGREARTQKLFIRNYTYLPPSLEGDESGGTPPRASTRASWLLHLRAEATGRARSPSSISGAATGMCGSSSSTLGRRIS
jgi:hypothetical protein